MAWSSGSVGELNADAPRVVATGGLAPVIASDSSSIHEVDEFLTLDGLRILYEMNASPSS
ncbi:MAG: hypothetical protein HC923_09500 [Myxococcales bacterium]|nr:hypothetical protein [Myxococcales bacterium]